ISSPRCRVSFCPSSMTWPGLSVRPRASTTTSSADQAGEARNAAPIMKAASARDPIIGVASCLSPGEHPLVWLLPCAFTLRDDLPLRELGLQHETGAHEWNHSDRNDQNCDDMAKGQLTQHEMHVRFLYPVIHDLGDDPIREK